MEYSRLQLLNLLVTDQRGGVTDTTDNCRISITIVWTTFLSSVRKQSSTGAALSPSFGPVYSRLDPSAIAWNHQRSFGSVRDLLSSSGISYSRPGSCMVIQGHLWSSEVVIRTLSRGRSPLSVVATPLFGDLHSRTWCVCVFDQRRQPRRPPERRSPSPQSVLHSRTWCPDRRELPCPHPVCTVYIREGGVGAVLRTVVSVSISTRRLSLLVLDDVDDSISLTIRLFLPSRTIHSRR
ncbi:hypothetical protein SAMN04487948_13224 [Halogranum amylolyticum]|uniref:Uncharacterized protein n=1 Tax=Halogranum amylolyticum TaxID=660520 RepID=A0A1H8WKI4_9EURY|nr:hypothetical protein SAMN04487948_13224 [Halogranum amylolyticum]